MWFRLLGPVEIDNAGKVLRLPRRRDRSLLAVLLLSPNRVVSIDRLADLLWDGEPPDRARRMIHSHISRVRGLLGDEVAVELVGDGYRIDLDPNTVDAHRFQTMVAEAATVVDPAGRIERLRAALDLWHGRPLDNAASDRLRDRLCRRLEEQHLTATEDLFSASLDIRRERDVLPELAQLAAAHPAREGLIGLHMRALYQAGRKAEALEVYRRARVHLADELGIEPGVELRERHQAILRDELVAPAAPPESTTVAGSPTGTSAAIVPRQLPADVSGFTGRDDQLDELDALLDGDGKETAVVISAIGGTAGVGKTALAVHWAHRVRDRFPDGQLYVNLRGYDPDQPLAPTDALSGFLFALGISDQDVPDDLDGRAARFRSEVADKRLLMVLDNVRDVGQVRPLLPGGGSCVVVVTSRDRLAGLVAVHGARRLDLGLLPPAEAITLMRRLVGPRVDTEPEAAVELVDQCARLPLALRVAAELATSRPADPLAKLVVELDQRRRLELLDGADDPRAAPRSVFSWSLRHLPSDAVASFRLLGLNPGPDIDPYAAAALAGIGIEDARRRLELLSRAHLLQPTDSGRYAMHDLLRAYAAELAGVDDTDDVVHAALGRLVAHYRYVTSVAMDIVYPSDRERRPRIPPVDTPVPDLSDPSHALDWLDVRHPNLLAAARYAADHGWPEHTLDLSTLLRRHLQTRGRYGDAETFHHLALATARSIGDRAGELEALGGLGRTCLHQGRYEQAAEYFTAALGIARASGDRIGELDALHGLGSADRRQERLESAIDHYRQALEIARIVGDRVGELNALNGLGGAHRLQGRHQLAAEDNRQALEIARETGNRAGEMAALNGIAYVDVQEGRYESAIDHYRQELAIARSIGHRVAELAALTGLGDVHRLRGQLEQAAEHYQQTLDVAREAGDRNWLFEALQGLGRLHYLTGGMADALAHHRDALELATDLGHLADQARAHDGIAHAHRALNQPEQARRHWQYALDILTDLGVDRTEDPEATPRAIRAHLAALGEPIE